MSLSRFAELSGVPVAAAANEPLVLDDPNHVWLVESGGLDLFFVDVVDGVMTSRLNHLMRAESGRLVFSVEADSGSPALIAKGLPGSRVLLLELSELSREIHSEALRAQLDAWISDFSSTVAANIDPRPRTDILLKAGVSRDADAQAVVSTHPDSVIWVQANECASFLDTEELDPNRSDIVPLTSDTWLTLNDDMTLSCVSSQSLSADLLLQGLAEFHRLALHAEQLNRSLQIADTANQQIARVTHHRQEKKSARALLFSVLGTSKNASSRRDTPLALALDAIGRHERIDFNLPTSVRNSSIESPPLQDILQESGIQHRRIRLVSDDRWWRGDSGPILAFRHSDNMPVALLPGIVGNYRRVDPISGKLRRITARQADDYQDKAWMFYRSFPKNGQFSLRDLTVFAFERTRVLIVILMLVGLLATLQLIAPALLVGTLANRLIPPVADGTPVFFTIIFLGLAVFSTLILVLQGVIAMKLEGRVAARVAAGIIDHAMKLPLAFFRQFRTGELMTRMMGLWTLRDQLSGVITHIVLMVAFTFMALLLLFLFDTTLAVVCLIIGISAFTVTLIIGSLQLTHQRARFSVVRDLAGKLHQYIGGVNKLRSAGAEDSAFASWARGYRDQLTARRQSDVINRHLIAFTTSLPALGSAVLFVVAINQHPENIEISDFLVAFILLTMFLSALANLGLVFELLAASVTIYEQVDTIISVQPAKKHHDLPADAPPVKLSGDVHFDNVSFRYNENDPLVLEEVSLHIRPGEFVAIVGPSGSGKSTLFRLALGLEEPHSGAVYFDRRDLTSLSAESVRRQVGMVSQDLTLQPGNILQNIVGLHGDLTIDDAWRAARLADVDQDIAHMSMQMFTPIGDNLTVFSGGQMQRIQIAAALVRSPRIVFLDEATSWLDSNTQARVMKGIESLSATRVVIAHRLSTVQHADRIYVLSDGRIAQHGTFDELSESGGIFRQLMARQMT